MLRKALKRAALALVTLLMLVVLGLTLYVATHQNLRFDHALPPLAASGDPAVIARGEYLVRSVRTEPIGS